MCPGSFRSSVHDIVFSSFFSFPDRSLISDESAVTVTILDVNALALKMFFNSLNCHASKLLEKVGCNMQVHCGTCTVYFDITSMPPNVLTIPTST